MPYFSKSQKAASLIQLFEEAITILSAVGIPIANKTERNLERMAMAFLAVAGVTKYWNEASDQRFLKTREVINFINLHFEENISSGSYDDVRRKDLKLLVVAGLILNSSDKPNAATNDPTRGYSLDTAFQNLIHSFETADWEDNLARFLAEKILLDDLLARQRDLLKIPIHLPNGVLLELSSGKHNDLQKAIIEDFLPRYGQNCSVLYLGDTANKMLFIDKLALETLHFFELSHDELPDIIAYNQQKNWLYLIEAVHSSGSISEIRMLELKRLTKDCTADIVYVTAFLTKSEFKKWVTDIAWETEVWIAENPDHLIHFNGDKFLGPYKDK
jgi:BsuBI/PstI restriction endonuclease domain/BsuBI/PstI restriction endonuclease HTH domain